MWHISIISNLSISSMHFQFLFMPFCAVWMNPSGSLQVDPEGKGTWRSQQTLKLFGSELPLSVLVPWASWSTIAKRSHQCFSSNRHCPSLKNSWHPSFPAHITDLKYCWIKIIWHNWEITVRPFALVSIYRNAWAPGVNLALTPFSSELNPIKRQAFSNVQWAHDRPSVSLSVKLPYQRRIHTLSWNDIEVGRQSSVSHSSLKTEHLLFKISRKKGFIQVSFSSISNLISTFELCQI